MPTLGGSVLRYVGVRRHRGELRPRSAQTLQTQLWHFAVTTGVDLAPSKLRRRHVEAWLDGRRLAPATRRNQLSMVRTFCRWLITEGLLKADPTLGIGRVRQPRSVPRGLNPAQINALFAVLPDERAVLIVTLMVQEGLRCCEVAALEVGQVDWHRRAMLISGKGGHERVLPMSDQTAAAVSHYLAAFPASAGPLVRSYSDDASPLSAKTVSAIVGRWMHDAGLAESAHSLRHTAATDMLLAGAHLRNVQAALGHAKIQNTEIYLPWVVGDLREAMGGRVYGVSA